MKKAFLIYTFLLPTIGYAENLLCIPDLSMGWSQLDASNEFVKINHHNKWVLQPISPKLLNASWTEKKIEVNYSLKKLGSTEPVGFCYLESGLYNPCFWFNWPKEKTNDELRDKINSELENKLIDHPNFQLVEDKNDVWSYILVDAGSIRFRGLFKSSDPNPEVALERGLCEKF